MLFNSIIMNAKTFIVIIIFFLSSRYLLEALGVDGFGLYSLVLGISITLEFIFSGLTTTTSRYTSMAIGKNDLIESRKVFNTVNVVNRKIMIVFLLVLELFGMVMLFYVLKIPNEQFNTAIIIFQILVADSYFKIKIIPYNALLTAKENFLFINAVAIAVAILRLASILLLLIYPFDRVIAYSIIMFLLSLLSRLVTIKYVTKRYNEAHVEPKKYYDEQLQKDVFSFLKYSWIGQIGNIIKKQGGNFLLNIFSGGVALNAAYAAATQVASTSDMAFSPVNQSFTPQIMKSYSSGNTVRFINLTLFNSKLAIFLSWIIIIPLIFGSDFILNIWLKDVPAFTGEILILILIDEMIRQLSNGLGISGIVLASFKKIYLVNTIFQLISFIVSLILLSFGLDFRVIFYVNIVVSVLLMIINVVYAHLNLGINGINYTFKIILPLILLIFAVMTVYSGRFNLVILNSLYSIVLSFIIMSAYLVFVMFDKNDKVRMMHIFNEIRSKMFKG